MNGRRRAAGLGLAAMMLAAAFATPAGADDCPPLEPACVVDSVDDVVDDVVDDTTDTLDEVTDAAKDGVDEVVTTVDDTLGDPSGGADPGPEENGGGGGGTRGGGRSDVEPEARPHGRAAPLDLPSSTAVLPEVGLVAKPGPARSGGPVTGSGVVGLATGLALLSFLLAVMIGFVSFQHVLDRGDPKLAPETLAADLVPFA